MGLRPGSAVPADFSRFFGAGQSGAAGPDPDFPDAFSNLARSLLNT
ncbi:hypothetical protein Y88_1559 [Novosphingobium nitrogenifigens DSM 19370]|uniref:Uncharacterized protein n=1 Tax=Novosphingobium nitrogenifigens DSM 19370 TaxID=983920 RepID=F1Z7L3_9SPHN|nr:hypothetical protein Y88_1559 [Novosphingobium nitrogenifigens DSM 19370]